MPKNAESQNIELILRHTIIDLLDNENGVNDKGFEGISKLCERYGWEDILDKVDSFDSSGHFLWEDDAQSLRNATRVIR